MSSRRSRSWQFAVCSAASLIYLAGSAGPVGATDFGMFATSPLSLHPEKSVASDETFTVDVGFKLEPGSSISSYSMSVEFDTDLGNELEFVSASQPVSVTASGAGVSGGPLTPSGTPVGIDSSGSTKGTIKSFAGSTTPGSGIVNGGAVDIDVIVGSITFKARSTISTDGVDAVLGFFDPADQVSFDSGSDHAHITFGDLAVNLTVPLADGAMFRVLRSWHGGKPFTTTSGEMYSSPYYMGYSEPNPGGPGYYPAASAVLTSMGGFTIPRKVIHFGTATHDAYTFQCLGIQCTIGYDQLT